MPLRALLAVAGAVTLAAAGSAPPDVIAAYADYPAALPNAQLPDVPLAGNGHFGVALDAYGDSGAAGHQPDMGPGRPRSIDIWLSSGGMWNCKPCTTPPACYSPALCRIVAFGGASLTLGDGGALGTLIFSATQRLADGRLAANLTTTRGGVLGLTVALHPNASALGGVASALVANATWLPATGEPAAMPITWSYWLLGGSADLTEPGAANVSVDAATLIVSGSRLAVAAPASSPWPASMGFAAACLVFASADAPLPLPNQPPQAFAHSSNASTTAPYQQVNATLTLQRGQVAAAMIALSDSWGPAFTSTPHAVATVALQAQLAALAGSGTPIFAAVSAAATAWWGDFWSQSSVALPSQPQVEAFWYGAQYVLGSTASVNASVPAPGLYGVWVFVDQPNWHGDYTLDYNFESTFYGAFSSNHGQQTVSYYPAITGWFNGSAAMAQDELVASGLNATCPDSSAPFGVESLHSPCHLGPWGMQSQDRTVYMHWNLPFAAMLFLDAMEYAPPTQAFAVEVARLTTGLSHFWRCYLANTTVNGSYVYSDFNLYNPDQQHEGQPVANPQIGLSFIQRVAVGAQQAWMYAWNGTAAPAWVADMAAHLAPYSLVDNVPINVTAGYRVMETTRCFNDHGELPGTTSVSDCEAACSASPSCAVFTFCPSPAVPGCTYGPTCWQFDASVLPLCNASAAGWTSGVRNATTINAPVWTAYTGATIGGSDSFATYPLWPSQAVDLAAQPELTAVAAASARTYTAFVSGRPVDLFPLAVRAATTAPGWETPLQFSAGEILQGLRGYLAAYMMRNLLPRAPGGGVENVGVTQAVNEMLVVSAAGVVTLFPVWPRDQDAAFATLRVKSGILASAAFNGSTGMVSSPVTLHATSPGSLVLGEQWGGPAAAALAADQTQILVRNPWLSSSAVTSITVACGGAPPTSLPLAAPVLTFAAPYDVDCVLAAV